MEWFKSSYSSNDGPDCVEVAVTPASAPEWSKSSYSGSNDNDCVEVAATPTTVLVRDSKTPHRPHLALTPTAWADFVSYTRER
ncbi:DUF397 domain-containing protein [Streptomyces sp. NPDC059568]|uniref:DUF397 domain-containing protein n=1 Tax=Streptomyces sp. NPDC059568 TaxID=3346868 RepID=UPI0036D0DEE3